MDEKEQNLTEKQRTVITKVIGARTITDGLRKAGVSKTTFYDWLRDDDFKQEIERQRREVTKQAFDDLRAGLTEAITVLRALLQSKEESIKLRAATTIVENVLKSIELTEMEDRICRLEVTLRR